MAQTSSIIAKGRTFTFSLYLYIYLFSSRHCFPIEYFFLNLLESMAHWWVNIIKWTQMNIWIYWDPTFCIKQISEYIWFQHIYQTNIGIYLYSKNSTNTNKNNIWGSCYSNIWIFVFITGWRNFLKGSLMLPLNKIL